MHKTTFTIKKISFGLCSEIEENSLDEEEDEEDEEDDVLEGHDQKKMECDVVYCVCIILVWVFIFTIEFLLIKLMILFFGLLIVKYFWNFVVPKSRSPLDQISAKCSLEPNSILMKW